MLHHSKFVNTKSYQKAIPKRGPLHFPSFSRSPKAVKPEVHEPAEEVFENDCSIESTAQTFFEEDSSPALAEPLPPETKVDKKPTVEVRKLHASINFDEMQRLEELNKVDGDWASFFLGTEPIKTVVLSESTELMPIGSFAGEPAPYFEPIMTPPPVESRQKNEPAPPAVQDGPSCLDEIFNELIAEDKVFKRAL